MLYLVTGGSGSGKSAYAEQAAVRMFEDFNKACKRPEGENTLQETAAGQLYYVATMVPYDEECRRRIARHRRMRKEKGFVTLECPCNIRAVSASKRDVLLLEDLSNLLANEQYLEEGRIRGDGGKARQQACEVILQPLLALSRAAGCVVVVTNEIFSDGVRYEPETDGYCRLLGFLNAALAAEADGVAEVVCSIPVCRKGALPC